MENVTTGHIAILISSFALAVSFASLAWNVYKELGLRPRVKVSLMVASTVIGPAIPHENRILIRAVNYGPGEVNITSIPLKSLWRHRKGGGYKWASVMPEPGQLPVNLGVGKEAFLMLAYNPDCFLSVKHARAGLGDSFGRNHWVSRKQLRRAEDTYENDFPLGSCGFGTRRGKSLRGRSLVFPAAHPFSPGAGHLPLSAGSNSARWVIRPRQKGRGSRSWVLRLSGPSNCSRESFGTYQVLPFNGIRRGLSRFAAPYPPV